jgi:hypothetical protein
VNDEKDTWPDYKPRVGELFEAFFCDALLTKLVVEWRGRFCYFSDGTRLIWAGDHIGFLL